VEETILPQEKLLRAHALDFLREMNDHSEMEGYAATDIREMLPHRFPFVFIDRVLELLPGERIVALKNISTDEGFLRGYSPQNGSMPPELLIEGMAQAGGVLVFASLPDEMHGTPVFFMAIDHVQVKRFPVPGDQVIFSVTFLKKSSWAVKFAASATINGSQVCEAELTATFGRKTGKRV
jgi:3-hydroxyacyl-[acyl-carrier-protein] dehydratase